MGNTATIINHPLELRQVVKTAHSLGSQAVLIFQDLSNTEITSTFLKIFFENTSIKIKNLNNENIKNGNLFLTFLDNLSTYYHLINNQQVLPIIMGNIDKFIHHQDFKLLIEESSSLIFFTPQNCNTLTYSIIKANFSRIYKCRIPIKTSDQPITKVYHLPNSHFEFYKNFEQNLGNKVFFFDLQQNLTQNLGESLPLICLFLSSPSTKLFISSARRIKLPLGQLSAEHIYVNHYFYSLRAVNTCSILKMMQYFIYRLFLDKNYDRRYTHSQNTISRAPCNG